MKRLMVYLSITFLFIFLTSCSWSPTIVKEGKFLPAETLPKHKLEIGVQSYLYIPSYFSISYGFTDRVEATISAHYLNGSLNINTLLYYQIIKTDLFLLTGNISELFFIEREHDFFANNTSIGLIPGLKLSKLFTIYTPLNVDYLYSGKWGNGFSANIGLGINLNLNRFRVSIEGNTSLPNEVGDIDILPFIGLGIFYRF